MAVVQAAVMFGGGGALGAFACGVWKALAQRLQGARLIGAAGSSIGAINAAFVVKHADDLLAGARDMEDTWRKELATPSFPFVGFQPRRMAQSWNGFLTGLFVGNHGWGRADHLNWNPWLGMNRFRHPLMDRQRMRSLLASRLGRFQTTVQQDPVLAAAAVDVMGGDLRLFDSTRGGIDALHLSASAAIPLLFEPVDIDGRLYWDGDVSRQAALPLFLDVLRHTGRLPTEPAPGTHTVLVTIDQMSASASKPPTSDVEIVYRMMELLMHGKMALPPEALRGFTHVLAIQRPPLDHDAVSGQMDYSPERIDELIELGMAEAQSAWARMDGMTARDGSEHGQIQLPRIA
jgi:NTE family protein